MTDPKRDFPYDLARIYSNIYSRFERHTELCRQEIVALKAELAVKEQELELLREKVDK